MNLTETRLKRKNSTRKKSVKVKKEQESITQPEITRAELNLEKWPSIWQPSKSRGKIQTRIISREISLPDGSKISAKVEIAYTSRGVLTTEDQKLYYILIDLWEKNGRPEEISFSMRQLPKLLGKQWGTETREALKQSLVRLGITPFIWTNSYHNSVTKETYRELKTFTILSDLHIAEKDKEGHSTKQNCRAKFNSLIDANLRNSYNKPLLAEVILNFKSGISQLLYGYLDLVMSDKKHFERRTQELFKELGLKGDAYKNASKRKQILNKPIFELNGAKIATGVLTVTMGITSDRTDFKLIVEKDIEGCSQNLLLEAVNIEQLTVMKVETKKVPQEATISPSALIRCFFDRFSIKRSKPSFGELKRASELIDAFKLTFEQGVYLVNFSFHQAKETGFSIQTFGGIVQYVENALIKYFQEKNENTTMCNDSSVNKSEICEEQNLQDWNELERKDELAQELFEKLPKKEQAHRIRIQLEEFRHSEHWPIYSRWSKDVLNEHLWKWAARKFVQEEKAIS